MKKPDWSAAAVHAFLIAYSLLTLVPFVWAILTSLKTTRELAEATQLLPVAFNLDAYRTILASDFKTWFFNSMFVALVVTLLGVVSNSLAGYALARLRFLSRTQSPVACVPRSGRPSGPLPVPAYTSPE